MKCAHAVSVCASAAAARIYTVELPEVSIGGKVVSIAAFTLASGFLAGVVAGRRIFKKNEAAKPSEGTFALHWNPRKERRGLGDLVKSLNHVAIIVSDVGRSLAFYVEVLGFQQIQRPNFDRHGGWCTMGNVELHLIKGRPVVHSGEDLIVSHLALESDHPELVLQKLIEMKVPFRQNISVPDPKKARENTVESFTDSKGKVTQYFIRDPDGYYLEICNCDILTKFCLEAEAKQFESTDKKQSSLMDIFFGTYSEGRCLAPDFTIGSVFKIACVVKRLIKRARSNLRRDIGEHLAEDLRGVVPADVADEVLLTRLQNRQKTYSDVTQGFTHRDLVKALKRSGNDMPKTILILRSMRHNETVMLPPVYLMNEGGEEDFEAKGTVNQHVHKTVRRPSFMQVLGSTSMYAGAAFKDNTRQAYDVDHDEEHEMGVAAKLQAVIGRRVSRLFGMDRQSFMERRGTVLAGSVSSFAEVNYAVSKRRASKQHLACLAEESDAEEEEETLPTLLGTADSSGVKSRLSKRSQGSQRLSKSQVESDASSDESQPL